MKLAINRIYQLYQDGGILEISRGIKDYVGSRGKHYQDGRTDNEDRWEFITSKLTNHDSSLIDIGCAEGYFVVKAALSGMQATGYDMNYTRITKARGKFSDAPNLNFVLTKFTPESIKKLPPTDVILFMTVHHHWESQYGIITAKEMFETLLNKSNKLFWEPPGDMKVMFGDYPKQELNVNNKLDWYKKGLCKEYGDDIKILDSTIVGYGSYIGRSDPLFYIDSSNYES